MRNVLVIVDVQVDFVTGSLGSDRAMAIIPNVKSKIEERAKRGDLIIFTQDTHGNDYLDTQEGKNLPVEHCIYGTPGWKIYGDLDNIKQFKSYLNKDTFGYIDWRGKLARLEIGDIEIIGLCTDICVVSNALILKAMYPENKITVDASCCAGVTEESHNAALLTMKMCQVNIINE